MTSDTNQYFNSVQGALHQQGQPTALSADERDLVDDYEAQGFSADVCAAQITHRRG